MDKTINTLRKEVNTRSAFAKKEAEKAFDRIKIAEKSSGNVTTCAAADRFVRAFNIQKHYHNEFHNFITRKD